ncbi:MAG: hypothetical protein NTW86_04515 [Candidatus Sumerlaeota bacterium]|nr:hypothetical protein [Candidatus Sumerlaeota bacterium]
MAIRVPDTKTTKAAVYKEAGEARYEEAVFLEDSHPSGAIYLAGYLVECYLKWAVCARNKVQYLQDLPDTRLAQALASGQGHNLEAICRMTGYDVHFRDNERVKRAFQMATAWSPNIRYSKSCGGKREAVQFLAAVKALRDDIRAWGNIG